MKLERWQGMGTFGIVLAGEVVSFVGSGLTNFGIGVRIFQQDRSITHFALVALSTVLPLILLSPIAGVLADRFDRRRLLILGNLGSAICSGALFLSASAGRLEPWHIYPIIATSSAFASLIWPTLTAATTMLVRKDQFGHASGMTQTGSAVSEMIAPALAGFLLVSVGLRALILIDVCTFLFACLTLAIVKIPSPERREPVGLAGRQIFEQLFVGWRFIRERSGLLRLLGVISGQNFCLGMVQVLITPLVLSFASPDMLGVVLSVASSGLLLGGLLMSVWGGSKRRVDSILVAMTLQGALLMLGGVQPNAVLVTSAAFVFLLAIPVIVGSSQALWQSKVPPEVQGRVFATRRMIGGASLPLALAVAGPLADHVFEPLMARGGLLAGSVGRILGAGEGRGIGLLFVVTGFVLLGVVVAAFRSGRLRSLEDELPDAIGERAEEA
ncbi:MAG: MFS transporter [Acidobacteriota bacterium]|jgi:MFS family permease